MKSVFLFLVIFGSVFSQAQEMPYLDEQFKCTSTEEAQKMVKDFKVDVKSFGGMELCNSQVDLKKLLNDLSIIKDGRFSSSGSNVYIRNFIPSDKYYEWMKSMTRGMNRGNDVPAATAYNRFGYFTMQDGWTKLSTLGRVGTVLHEARHTENYVHIPCKQGPYMNSSMQGCDRDYSYGGSHAVEMEYYARVSVLGQNFHPVYKSMARLMAIARSNFVFNTSPIQAREGLFALGASSQQGVLFDKENSYTREVPSAQGVLKRTSYGATIFSGNQAYAIEMYDKTGSQTNLLDTYSYFKLLFSSLQNVKDFEEFDVNTKRFALALTQNNQIISYNFPAGKWGSEINLNMTPVRSTTTVETGEKGYFLIDAQSSIYNYDPATNKLSAPLNYKWNPDFVNIAAINGRLFILKKDGKIYEKMSSGNIELAQLPQENYSSMTAVPLYDGFEVKR